MAQLSIDRTDIGFELSLVLGSLEALVAAALMLHQGIRNQPHHLRERDLSFVGSASMFLEDIVEKVVLTNPVEKGQSRFCDRQPIRNLSCKFHHDNLLAIQTKPFCARPRDGSVSWFSSYVNRT